MAGTGRMVVSNNKQTVGLHLAQWQTQPTAILGLDEAQELVRRLEKAIGEIKAASASDAEGFEDLV